MAKTNGIDKEKQIKRQNDFINKSYDRINLTVPKGKKDAIKEMAKAKGQSVNELINILLEKELSEFEFSKCMNPPEE